MKKIVVIGSSIAGIKALEEVRAVDQESEITLFCSGPFLPVRPDLFFDFLAQEVGEDKMFYRPKDFYQDQRITVILDKNIDKINFNKKVITTEEKEKFPFDILIITETAETRFPYVKGVNKTGVSGFRTFAEVKGIAAALSLSETVAVQSNSLQGIKTARAIRKRGKDVVLINHEARLLADELNEETSRSLLQALESENIEVINGNDTTEIIGNGDLKAVRLKSGKVIACDLAVFPDAPPELKKFSDSPLEIDEKIYVDAHFQTSMENVYALGEASQRRGPEDENEGQASFLALEEQGKVVGSAIIGQPADYREPLAVDSLNLGGLSILLIGKTKSRQGIREVRQTAVDQKIYKKVLVDHDVPIGAVLVNADSEKENMVRLIQEKVGISGQDGRIFQESRNSDEIQQLAG